MSQSKVVTQFMRKRKAVERTTVLGDLQIKNVTENLPNEGQNVTENVPHEGHGMYEHATFFGECVS